MAAKRVGDHPAPRARRATGGKGFSLKRSSALDGKHPDHVGLLETLNIFAVRANYMSQFRDYLEKEGVETEGDVELPLEIKPNEDFLDRGLVVPEDRSFTEEADILLEPDKDIRVRVDMSLKVQALESGDDGIDVRATLVVGDVIRTCMAVQVKKWKLDVQTPVVQQVRGSLGTHEQGLIITTSDFSPGARTEAARPDAVPVALMNGEQLVVLLVESGIGITRRSHDLIELGDNDVASQGHAEGQQV